MYGCMDRKLDGKEAGHMSQQCVSKQLYLGIYRPARVSPFVAKSPRDSHPGQPGKREISEIVNPYRNA